MDSFLHGFFPDIKAIEWSGFGLLRIELGRVSPCFILVHLEEVGARHLECVAGREPRERETVGYVC